MTRIVLERLSLFVLPFVLYYVYLLMLRLAPPPASTRSHPWTILVIAGLSLVALSFFVWRATDTEPTTGTYIAPHVVNGKIIPGYVKPAEGKP